MIPLTIDRTAILADLNTWGFGDYKIEAICGFSIGYVAQLKCGNIGHMSYERAARLYNFWEDERNRRVPHETVRIHTLVITTS